MALPNFFIPGAQKSGTTTLYKHLKNHPEIFMCSVKEPGFFSYSVGKFPEISYEEGLAAYEGFYEGVHNEKVLGEATPHYMTSRLAIERIKKDIENPKFIFTIRNPVNRIYSLYNMLVSQGRITEGFFDAFGSPPFEKNVKPHNAYEKGLYAKWIQKYIDVFGRENIHVMVFEKWTNDLVGELNACYSFLGVENLEEIEDLKHNVGKYFEYDKMTKSLMRVWKRLYSTPLGLLLVKIGVKDFCKNIMLKSAKPLETLSKEERQKITAFYAEDVANLREILQDPLNEWSADFPV